MFEKGEYIMYGHSGICLIEDITHLNLAGVDRKKLYYVLVPQNIKGSRIYFPIEKENANARRLITKEEAWKLLDEIRDIEEIWVGNDKLREEQYKAALNSGDYRRWVSIIKTLYLRKQERIAQGKKMAAMDERYMKLAEEALYSELAFVMGKEKSEMETFIREHIEKMELEEV